MKWFKHHSDALDDPFVQELMDEFSHFGYVVWFGLIEIISKENGSNVTGKLSISPKILRRKLRASATKLRQVLDFCQTNARLSVNYSEKKWEINFPKIMEIKDNYIKDLQASCKKLSPIDKEEEKEIRERDKDKEKKSSISQNTPEEFIGKLKDNPAYQHIDIDHELSRMDAWLSLPKNKGRKKTSSFVLNWMNKIERPMEQSNVNFTRGPSTLDKIKAKERELGR